MNIKYKFEIFSKTALAEAIKKSDVVIKKLEEDYITACEKVRAETKKESDERIAEEERLLEAQSNQALSQARFLARRKLFDAREALTDNMFGEVKAALEEYARSSPEYVTKLTDNIHEVLTKYSGEEITLYLTADDIKHISHWLLGKGYGPRVGTVVSEGLIGGFKASLKGGSVIIDNSYDTLLKQERENFRGIKIRD